MRLVAREHESAVPVVPRVVADFVARGELSGAMQVQVRRVGGCEQPIRMRGQVDLLDMVSGEVREAWSSEGQPDGTVLVACGNRRASRCAPCSRLYQGDSSAHRLRPARRQGRA